ncbi:MAG: hypothetical protein MJ147_08275 [Clostridia bacterium]|nr:hypothetical protein [Clostridia bacterium]
MMQDLMKIFAYTVVFSVFNLFILLIYFICGQVVLKKKAKKIRHSDLSVDQINFLERKQFKNIRYEWLKKFGENETKFSIIYFVLSEIVCFVAILLTSRYVLICRAAILIDAVLFLVWIFLLIYYNKKNKKLAEEHKENLEKALEKFDNSKTV